MLFLGWRNKYCTLCSRASNAGITVKTHTCYKNYTGSSTGMEADIIVDAFLSSEEMYGVKYATLVADGDASVYSKILLARPYEDMTVEKIECSNHLLRNYAKKLQDIVKDGKFGSIVLRKKVGGNIVRLRNSIPKAANYRSNQNELSDIQKLQELKKDILNSPHHIFGNHSQCSDYFCDKSNHEEENLVPELMKAGLFGALQKLVNILADHARSLLRNLNSNVVEQFFSIISKFISGKRINYTQRRSYQGRCTAAVVSHSTHRPIYALHKKMYKNSPGKYTKLFELQKLRALEKRRRGSRKKKIVRKLEKADCNYGPHAQKPDMADRLFEEKKKEFLASLAKTETEIKEIERETVLQRESGKWLEERRKLLTASFFGQVCLRKPQTSCQSLVKSMLYSNFNNDALQYGIDNESEALCCMEEIIGDKIEKCGLYIDCKLPYLGATPDGLVSDYGIVEVKCPSSAKHLTPQEAIFSRKITFWNIDKDKTVITGINKNHRHFFQIQGQLHVTNRDKCFYGVWTPLGMKVEEITRDDEFWKSSMEEKLSRFYMDCILPELVDPRQRRSMLIRDPSYILQAQERLKSKKRIGETVSGIPKSKKKLRYK